MKRLTVFLISMLLVVPALAAGPGRVDGDLFLDLASDDGELVEVSLQGALLKLVGKMDPELARLVEGLESIHAVIVGLDSDRTAAQAKDLVRRTEADLQKRGWERLARVQEAGAEVKILLLYDDEVIRGLVVMAADFDERQLVFANIAGELDLAAIAELGEEMDIPGLDQVKP